MCSNLLEKISKEDRESESGGMAWEQHWTRCTQSRISTRITGANINITIIQVQKDKKSKTIVIG